MLFRTQFLCFFYAKFEKNYAILCPFQNIRAYNLSLKFENVTKRDRFSSKKEGNRYFPKTNKGYAQVKPRKNHETETRLHVNDVDYT